MNDATYACAALACEAPGNLTAGVPLCGKHYTTLKAEMNQPILSMLPVPLIPLRPGTIERFAAKIRLSDDDACRLRWIKPDKIGYGRFLLNGEDRGAHVASHLMFVGPVPDGWHVDHVRKRGCTHTDCVWWEHLEAVTPEENIRRGDAWLYQSSKTHCPAGHEYTPENIYWRSDGGRGCRTCTKDRGAERYRRLVNPNPDIRSGGLRGGATRGAQQRAKTHCPQGHEYTEDNIYWSASGGRRCKSCGKASAAARTERIKGDPEWLAHQREYQREWRRRKRAERQAEGVTDGTPGLAEGEASRLPGFEARHTA
jgi:hypothetical protein